MPLLSNSEILMANLKLINTCISFQASKYNLQQYIEDIKQEIYLIILEYPNEKLNTIHAENHMNAFVTGILVKQLYSKTSSFYRRYRKFSEFAPYQLEWYSEFDSKIKNASND